jgi:hypothetical protein
VKPCARDGSCIKPSSDPREMQPASPGAHLSLAFLIIANLLPLVGVLFFGWDVAALIVLYWSENLVIGFYNLLKMAFAEGVHAVFPALFFLIHYGGFCAVHGLFIVSLLLEEPARVGDDPPWPLFLVFIQLLFDVVEQVLAQAPPEWILAFIGLFISHGYSFVNNFLLGGERDVATTRSLMSAPYKRIVVLHVAIIAGGFAVISLGQPLLLLIVLIGLKLALDIALHRQERRRSAAT